MNLSNSSNNGTSEDTYLSNWVLLVFGFGFAVEATVTVVGNLIVLLSFARDPLLRVPRFFYIFNLCLCDLVRGAVVIPMATSDMITHGVASPPFCLYGIYLAYMLFTESALSIMMISLDRYLMIRSPLRYMARETSVLVTGKIIASWVVANAWNILTVLNWHNIETLEQYQSRSVENICGADYEYSRYIYVFTVVEFAIPLCTIALLTVLTYIRVQATTKSEISLKQRKPTLRAKPSLFGASLKSRSLRHVITDMSHPTPRRSTIFYPTAHQGCDVDSLTNTDETVTIKRASVTARLLEKYYVKPSLWSAHRMKEAAPRKVEMHEPNTSGSNALVTFVQSRRESVDTLTEAAGAMDSPKEKAHHIYASLDKELHNSRETEHERINTFSVMPDRVRFPVGPRSSTLSAQIATSGCDTTSRDTIFAGSPSSDRIQELSKQQDTHNDTLSVPVLRRAHAQQNSAAAEANSAGLQRMDSCRRRASYLTALGLISEDVDGVKTTPDPPRPKKSVLKKPNFEAGEAVSIASDMSKIQFDSVVKRISFKNEAQSPEDPPPLEEINHHRLSAFSGATLLNASPQIRIYCREPSSNDGSSSDQPPSQPRAAVPSPANNTSGIATAISKKLISIPQPLALRPTSTSTLQSIIPAVSVLIQQLTLVFRRAKRTRRKPLLETSLSSPPLGSLVESDCQTTTVQTCPLVSAAAPRLALRRTASSCQVNARRVGRSLAILVGVYMICWLPSSLSIVANRACDGCVPETISMLCSFIAYLDPALNPFLYGLSHKQFAKNFKEILHGRLLKRRRT